MGTVQDRPSRQARLVSYAHACLRGENTSAPRVMLCPAARVQRHAGLCFFLYKEKPSSRFRHRKITRTQNRKTAQGKGAARAPPCGTGPASRWSLLLSFKEKPSSRFRHRKKSRTQNCKDAQGKGAARAPPCGIKVLCFFLARKKGKKEGQKRRTVLLDGPLFWFTASQSHGGGRLPRTGRRRCTFGGPPWPGRSPR